MKFMMMEHRAADPFISDGGGATFFVSFFDSENEIEETTYDTLLMVQGFGHWY